MKRVLKKHSIFVISFILVVTVFVQMIVWKSFNTGYTMSAKYTPLVDAAMEVKLEASLGYLWLEDLMHGSDSRTYSKDVEAHFNQAIWYADAMLMGGENSEGTYVPLSIKEKRMRSLVLETRSDLIEIKELSLELLNYTGEDPVINKVYLAFNESFNSLTNNIDDVESELQLIIERDLENYLFLRDVTMLILLLLAGALLISYRFVLLNERQSLYALLEIEEENARLNKHLEMTLKKAPEAVCWITEDGHLTYVNDMFCDITGYTRQELLKLSVSDLYVDQDLYKLHQNWDLVKKQKKMQYESQFRVASGKIIDVEIMAAYASDENQEIKISYLRDMTDRNRMLNELEALNHGLSKSQELIDRHIPIATSDLKGNIMDCNLAYTRLTGYERSELVGHNFSAFSSKDNSSKVHQELWATIIHNRTWEGELKNIRKDGSEYWVRSIINPYFDEHGNKIGYKTVREEVTDKKTLEVLAVTDVLTGLFNRTKFDEIIRYEMVKYKRQQTPTTLVLCDIDLFKKVNDEHGHLIGDEVLKRIANMIKDSLRESDVVARWGGEEFAILLPDTSPTEAIRVSEKIRLFIESYEFEDVGKVTLSFGLSALTENDNESSWFKRTDEALYQSKESGRNKVTLV